MSDYLRPTHVSADTGTGGRNLSGHQKRRLKQQLPRVVFLARKEGRVMLGAVLLAELVLVAGGELFVRVDRCVAFEDPPAVSNDSFSKLSTLWYLRPNVEQDLRRRDASVGGVINDHFTEFAGSRWPVWPLSTEEEQTLRGPDDVPCTMRISRSFATQLGVTPSEVTGIPNATAEARAEEERHADGTNDADGVADDSARADPAAPTPRITAADQARNHLNGLHTAAGGSCIRRYTVRAILLCLQLASKLRPAASLGQCMAYAASLFLVATGILLQLIL